MNDRKTKYLLSNRKERLTTKISSRVTRERGKGGREGAYISPSVTGRAKAKRKLFSTVGAERQGARGKGAKDTNISSTVTRNGESGEK